MADGLLSLDDRVVDYFPEVRGRVTGSRVQSMLVRDLAAMSTGHTQDTAGRVFTDGPEDPVLNFLLLPPDREPGSVFCYNQPATYTLAAIVQRVTGETLAQYLQRRVLDKLGATGLSWLQYPAGRDIGYSGLYATTDTIARLGQLYLGGGEWEGQQLLPRSWVIEATRAQVATGLAGPDGAWYGYQFRVSQHGYRGDGAYGQYCLVLPDEDAVVAITAQTRSPGRPDMQTVLTMVWEKLLPAFVPRTVFDGGGDDRLQARLDALALPALGGEGSPPAQGPGWVGTTFLPARGSCENQPSLSAIRVNREEGDWSVTLCEDGSELRGQFLGNAWVVTEDASSGGHPVPLASSGGWLSPTVLRFDIIFLESPHRLRVTCDLDEKAFHAFWSTPPGHSSHLRIARALTAMRRSRKRDNVRWDSNCTETGVRLGFFDYCAPVAKLLKVLVNSILPRSSSISRRRRAQSSPFRSWHQEVSSTTTRKRDGIALESASTSASEAMGRSLIGSFPAPSIRQGLRAISSSGAAVFMIARKSR